MDTGKLIECFEHYIALGSKPISRAVAEQRMLEKLTSSLSEDIEPLLPPVGYSPFEFSVSNSLSYVPTDI